MDNSASSQHIELMRLGAADAEDYRRLWRGALLKTPETFDVSWDEEAHYSTQRFALRLEHDVYFGAKDAGSSSLVGIVGLRVPEAERVRHKAVLSGVYVPPEYRGTGIGKALVSHALEYAAGKVEQVNATVFLSDLPALKLYRLFGFRQYGLEKRALKIGDRYHHQALLALPLHRRLMLDRRRRP